MIASYGESDFDRAVACVSVEPSPEALLRRFGFDWDYVSWVALDASAAVLSEDEAPPGPVVAYGGEAFTAGFLIGIHLPVEPRPDESALQDAVVAVQRRGRHAVLAEHCDLEGLARLETLYAGALVESMAGAAPDPESLRQPVTRIFEAGLAVGLLVASGEPQP